MSAQPDLERLTRLEGIGCARKRREDPRFIPGGKATTSTT